MKSKKTHRLVVELADKEQFNRFRAVLLQRYGVTVSTWVRLEMGHELGEEVGHVPAANMWDVLALS